MLRSSSGVGNESWNTRAREVGELMAKCLKGELSAKDLNLPGDVSEELPGVAARERWSPRTRVQRF